jgi:hypothetical protein
MLAQEGGMVARISIGDDEANVILHIKDGVAPARRCLRGQEEIDG